MNTAYRVLITARAEKDIAKLDESTKRRIRKALIGLAEDPHRNTKKLTLSEIGGFRARTGDWRIVFDIDGSNVIILRVGHRREIYRKRA